MTSVPVVHPDTRVLVIGAGHAGVTAAVELRKRGYSGRIILTSAEAVLPYERPPLSKEILRGATAPGAIGLLGAAGLEQWRIEFRPECAIIALDAHRRRAYDGAGRYIEFDHCLIATGAQARPLVGLPAGSWGVHYVRGLADAERLRVALAQADSVVVIGAGFLGLEVAASAAELGRKVTVLDAAPQLLPRAAPPLLAEWLRTRLERRGIDIRTRCEILAAFREADRMVVTLIDGTRVEAALAVVAIGQLPEVAVARTAGLDIDPRNGGIMVDESCRTSIGFIHAAGDCASQYHPWYGDRVRLESWQSANEQGAIAAAALLGQAAPQRAVPWFWTDLPGCNVQLLGSAGKTTRYVLRGEMDAAAAQPRFLLIGMQDHRLRHAVAVNAGGELRQLRALMEEEVRVDPALLGDESRPLKAIVRDLRVPAQ